MGEILYSKKVFGTLKGFAQDIGEVHRVVFVFLLLHSTRMFLFFTFSTFLRFSPQVSLTLGL